MDRAQASFTTVMELNNGLEWVVLRRKFDVHAPVMETGKSVELIRIRVARPRKGYVTVTVASRACFLFALALR